MKNAFWKRGGPVLEAAAQLASFSAYRRLALLLFPLFSRNNLSLGEKKSGLRINESIRSCIMFN